MSDSQRYKPFKSSRYTLTQAATAGLGAVVLLTIFVCLAVSASNSWPGFTDFLKGPAASWAQAIFGAGAILGAIGLGWWQDEQRRRSQNDDAARLIHIVRDMAYECSWYFKAMDSMRSTLNAVYDLKEHEGSIQKIDHLSEAVRSIPLHTLPNAYVLEQLLKLREGLLDARNELELEGKGEAMFITLPTERVTAWRRLAHETNEIELRLRHELQGDRPEDMYDDYEG